MNDAVVTALAVHPLDGMETEYPHYQGTVEGPAGARLREPLDAAARRHAEAGAARACSRTTTRARTGSPRSRRTC